MECGNLHLSILRTGRENLQKSTNRWLLDIHGENGEKPTFCIIMSPHYEENNGRNSIFVMGCFSEIDVNEMEERLTYDNI